MTSVSAAPTAERMTLAQEQAWRRLERCPYCQVEDPLPHTDHARDWEAVSVAKKVRRP